MASLTFKEKFKRFFDLTNRRKRKKVKKYTKLSILFVLAAGIALFFSLPFVYMILMSLMKDSNTIFQFPPTFFSDKLYFVNYVDAFNYINFGVKMFWTIVILVCGLAIGLTSSILIAYGFARFQNKYSNVFFYILLSTMMIPWVVTLIPSFAQFEFIGWTGTLLPLIIPWIGGSAFNVFFLRQFILGIPKELDEAAKIDGCSSFSILLRVIIPQLKPAIATLFVFSFISTWSDYIGPSIYLRNSPDLYTLSIGMLQFESSTGDSNWAHVMAASVMYSIPMVLVIVLCQRAFVRGYVNSGIK